MIETDSLQFTAFNMERSDAFRQSGLLGQIFPYFFSLHQALYRVVVVIIGDDDVTEAMTCKCKVEQIDAIFDIRDCGTQKFCWKRYDGLARHPSSLGEIVTRPFVWINSSSVTGRCSGIDAIQKGNFNYLEDA